MLADLTPQRGAERDWWLRILAPLLSLSDVPERRAAVAALADRRDLTDWRDRPKKLSERTVYIRQIATASARYLIHCRRGRFLIGEPTFQQTGSRNLIKSGSCKISHPGKLLGQSDELAGL